MPKRPKQKNTSSAKNQPGIQMYATIMFVDIQGCSEISNHLGLKDYNSFLTEFRKCAEDIYKTKVEDDNKDYISFEVNGDEAVFICLTQLNNSGPAGHSNERIAGNEAVLLLDIAVSLKLKWLISKENQKRINDNKMPTDLGIGINYGPIIVNVENNGSRKFRPEGYAINLGKRIESSSREGLFSQIFVSQGVKNNYENSGFDELELIFDKPKFKPFKGIAQSQPIYEVKYITVPTNWYDQLDNILGRVEGQNGSQLLIETLEKVKELNPGNLWFTANLAREYLFKYDLENRKDGQNNPEDSQRKILEQAENLFASCYQYAQDDSFIDFVLGLIYGEMGYFVNELRCYNKGLSKTPYYAEGFYYRGLCYSYILNKEERSQPESLNEIKSETLAIYEGLEGKDAYHVFSMSLKDFHQAILLRPNFSWAYYEIAALLNAYKSDLEHFKKYIEEKEPRLYEFLSGYNFEAQKFLDKAKKLNPKISPKDPYLSGLS